MVGFVKGTEGRRMSSFTFKLVSSGRGQTELRWRGRCVDDVRSEIPET